MWWAREALGTAVAFSPLPLPSPSPHPPGPGARAAPSSAARAAAPVAAAEGLSPPSSPAGEENSSPLEPGGGVEGRGTGADFESPLAPAADADDSEGSLAATLAASVSGPLVRNGLLDLGPFSSARGGEAGRSCCCAAGGAAAPAAARPGAAVAEIRCWSRMPLESALALAARRNLHDLPPILSSEGEGSSGEEAARERAAGRGLFFCLSR